jgi:hypothetical protein
MAAPTTLDGVTLWNPGTAPAGPPPPSVTHAWKDGSGFSFHDILDTLNPLQHIPIINSIYRWLTGDQPGNVARIVGDGLFGGPIGLAAGMFSVAFKEETGKDPGEMAIAALTGPDHPGAAVAAAAPAPGPAAATAPPAAPDGTTASAAPAAAAAPGPAHPLMPLFRSPGAAAPILANLPGGAEQNFLAQNAALQQRLYGARGSAPGRTITQPIPLQLSGPALPMPPARQPVAPALLNAAATPAPAAASASALPQNPPVDIPQRMLEALDKYARLQQQRGQQVDLSP